MRPRIHTAGLAVAALLAGVLLVFADPFPPNWANGTGTAIHFQPVAWPSSGAWIAYTRDGASINDPRDNDPSNGGTSPQSYVNVSSGCTDQSQPSVYYSYNAGGQVLFFRWRVQAPPNAYATGPSAGSYASTSPWSSALWTVFMDLDGDGFRDFAVHLDGSSGAPAASVDRLAGIYSTSKNQSLDYIGDATIKLISHNPTAFVDGPSLSDRILNFQNSLTPTASWPNGSSETSWDYGTTRSTLLNTGCGEYFIDYQIPLAMLNASGVGGPTVAPSTPMSLSFASANSLTNPLQKDTVVQGTFIANPALELPGGDFITPAGGAPIVQPIVRSITASGCGPTTLTANIADTLTINRTTSVASVVFNYYADTNANGSADDGNAWTLAAAATTANNPVGVWTASWNSSALLRGQYLIGVKATDASGNITWSYLDTVAVAGLGGAPNHVNPTGQLTATVANTCGTSGPSVSKAVTPSSVTAGGTATFTITVNNTLGSAITLTQISDALPAGFTYTNTTGGTLAPTTTPTNGDAGTVTWGFGAGVSIPAASSRTLIFTSTASAVAGTYANTVTATTSYGTLSSEPITVGVGAPSLTISKAASVSTANPGDAVAYTITYANPSPVPVTNAVITDVLPTGLTFVSASNGGSNTGGTVTWNIGSIPASSGPFTVTLNATVTTPYPSGAAVPLVNTASITSTETGATTGSSSLYVNSPRAALSIQNQGNVNQVAAGGQITYTISYSNTGDTAANSAVITDVIPTGWTFVSATGGGTNTSGTVTWNIGTVAANTTGTVTLTLQATNAFTGANPTTNTASISATGVSTVSDSFRAVVTQTGNVCNDYYFTNTTANVGFAGVRRLATTTAVTAANTGTAVSATWVNGNGAIELVRFYQDPAVTSTVSFTGATVTSSIWVDRANGASVDVTGQLFDYDPASGATTQIGSTTTNFGGSVTGEFQFSVTPSGTLTAGHRLLWVYLFANAQNNNTTTLAVQFGGTTAITINNSGGSNVALAKSSICTSAPANPVITNQVDKLIAATGDTLVYTIGFANAGQTNMTSAQVVNTLPAGVTFTSATLNGAAATAASNTGQQYTFNVNSSDTATAGQVTGGQSGTLVITAAVSQPFTGNTDTLTDTAALTSTQTSQISDTATTTLRRPSVTIAKSASTTLLAPGNTITYTLDVLNSGPGGASNVTVGDTLPTAAYFTYVAGSAKLNGVTITPDPVTGGNTLSQNIGSLAAGATARVTYQMLVANAGAPAGVTARSNTATVSDSATNGTRNSNTVNVNITTNPLLTFTKTSAPSSGTVAPGGTIVYTLTVTNVGNGSASDVRIVDPMPGSTAYVAGSLTDGGATRTDVADGDSSTFDGAGDRVVFTVGTLAAGATRTFTYTVKVATPLTNGNTTISSTATASASNAASQTATASITATAAPVLTLLKSAPSAVAFPLTTLTANAAGATSVTVANAAALTIGSTVSIGGTATVINAIAGNTLTLGTAVTAVSGSAVVPTWEYQLTYANTGNAAATGVVVSDVLAAGLSFVSASNSGVLGGSTVTWNLGNVAAGTAATLRLRVRPTSAGSYTNSATLASTELSTVTSNTTTTSVGSLVANKSTSTPAGSTSGSATSATYVISVENQSPTVTATNVSVADALPDGFSYLSTTAIVGGTASASPAAGDSQPTWSGLSIAPSSTLTITFVAKISNVAPATYQNNLTVTSASLSVIGFDAMATTAEDVAIAAALGTTGVVTITPLTAAGGVLTITVTDPDLNTNPAIVQTVQVSVVNIRTGEIETITLTETGANTGIFSGLLPTAGNGAAGTNNSGAMNVQNADTIRVTYTDGLTATGAISGLTADGSIGSTPPVVALTGAALAYTEGSGAVAIDAGLTVSDIDSPNLVSAVVRLTTNFVAAEDVLAFVNQNGITGSYNAATGVLTLTGSASVASYQAALRSVTYRNTSTNPATAARTFTVTVNDGGVDSNTASRSITIATVNDPPVVVMTATALTYTTGNGAAPIDASLTVTDVDSPNLVSAVVRLTTNFVAAEDVLAFVNQNGITGSYNAATGVLTLTGSASVASYQAALRSVTYNNTAATPSTATRTLSVSVNDGALDSNVATRNLTFSAAANTAPVVTMTGAALTYTAGNGAAAIDTGLTVADADSPNLVSAVVRLTINFVAAEDVLAFVNQNGITGSYNAATGVLTLTGSASVANYQAALRSVTYNNTAATPSTATRTLSVQVNDGIFDSNVPARNLTIAQATPNTPPVISPIANQEMIEGRSAPVVGFTVSDAETAAGALTVTWTWSNPALFPQSGLIAGGSGGNRTLVTTPRTARIGRTTITLTVSDGQLTASTSFVVTVRPRWDYYLAEGSTVGDSDVDIQIANPNDVPAPIRITYLTPDGALNVQSNVVAAGGRLTIRVDDIPELSQTEVATFIRSEADLPLLVERLMRWSPNYTAGSAATAQESTNAQWFFADGAEGNGFGTRLALANPNIDPVDVSVRFVTDTGTTVSRTVTVGATSRQTLQTQAISELAGRTFGIVVDSSLPIAVERSVSLALGGGRLAGHGSAGVPFPATTWLFSEGSDWNIYDTYIPILNPGDQPALVTVSFLTETGLVFTTQRTVPARARATIDTVASVPLLRGEHFGFRLEATQPVVAERTMYWRERGSAYVEMHNSAGVQEAATRWAIPDARIGGTAAWDTFILMANPSATQAADMRIIYKRDNGTEVPTTFTLPPLGRRTVNVRPEVPQLSNESFWATIESTNAIPFIAERSMYWDVNGIVRSGGTTIAALPIVDTSFDGCRISLSPQQINLGGDGGGAAVQVGATTRCTYEASSNAAWLFTSGETSGNGVTTFTYRAGPNPTSSARTAVLTIAGKSVVVRQAGRDAGASPAIITVDTPAAGNVQQPFVIAGWALDVGATTGTGIDFIDVWAYPDYGSGAPPVYVGRPAMGGLRPDVAAAFGAQFAASGYGLDVRRLSPGSYLLVIYAHSSVTDSFSAVATRAVAVTSQVQLVIDSPARSAVVTQPFVVAGWAVDRGSSAGSGIDAVDIWAYPNYGSGAPPVYVGSATMGGNRPDLGALFGSQFTPAGFDMSVQSLAPGPYLLVMSARSTVTGTFASTVTRDIVVQATGAMNLDLPAAGTAAVQPLRAAGWAIDRAATEGPGIDAIHVYAYPNPGSGAEPTFLGQTTTRLTRPDIGAAFGAQFATAGFDVTLGTLPSGLYDLVIYGRSTVTGIFSVTQTVRITVP